MGALLVALQLTWRGIRLLLNQLLKPGYPLAYHVCQLSRQLVFSSVSGGVRRGEYSQHFVDRLRVVDMILLIHFENIVVGDADLFSPCLLRLPFCVCQDYDCV